MFWRGFLGLLAVAVTVWVAGCAPPKLASFPKESISVPDDLDHYSSEVRPDGVVGGPGVEQVQAEIVAALVKRGEHAQADGSLGATASWALREAHQNRGINLLGSDAASRHFGFGGQMIGYMVFDSQAAQDWDAKLELIPRNVPITRYGIRLSPSGRTGAVVFANMEASYTPIARAFEPGQSVNLKGNTAQRFESCELFLTKPDGNVDKKPCQGRAFDATFPLTAAGVYRLEVMGDGASGPVIVAVLPLYVGVPEPVAGGTVGAVVEPEQAEARMFALLNEARRSAGVGPLEPDAELREVALAHSTDMADHHFQAHVSPSTGSPEDRARRAGLLVAMFGENLSSAPTPEVAHEGLMNSPGHRANMLQPLFTHVGIGARKSDTGIVVTMNFARRVAPALVPTSAAQVEAAIVTLRAKKGLPAAKVDRITRVAAQAGANASANGADDKDVAKAVQEALQKEVDRLHVGSEGGCISVIELLELSQLDRIDDLNQPNLRSYGVGARLRKDAKGTRLSTVLMLLGPACK
jgi:uncharacterized protein YkwD